MDLPQSLIRQFQSHQDYKSLILNLKITCTTCKYL